MKTTIGKVLAVAITVASLAFFGFVSVGVFGGTNWDQIARDLENNRLDQTGQPGPDATDKPYSFSRTTGEKPQWTATKNVGGGTTLPSDPALAPVVVAVMQDLNQSERTELQNLTPKVSRLDAEIAAAEAAIAADREAVQDKQDELMAILGELRDEVQRTTQEAQMQTEEVQKIRDRIEARREDVLRLGAQLEEVRGDRYRIQQIQQQLRDLIQQLDGSIERAERRRDQLNYTP
jgi:hypothetical protein